jgi:hypothetical protein
MFILVLLVGINMTTISGFNNRLTCEAAGKEFMTVAKREKQVRFYCFKV